ncbi:MAG: hypothetical protein MUP21_02055 [Dehalococcoidia bacterium]|nr:hypothetical protein [Dehalococcoidia bacterium]
MPFPANADGNVPFIGTRARYSILNTTATWVFHWMHGEVNMTGVAPRTETSDVDQLDPTVSAGRADYGLVNPATGLVEPLSEGGLFTQLGRYKRAMIVEASELSGGVTVTLVNGEGDLIRAFPALPAHVAAGEYIKAVGGAGAHAGFLVRLEGEKTW